MPARTIRPFVLLVLALAPPVAVAQQTPGPVPSNLDEMIAAALRSSPEILLAEARLRQAQAELNLARLQVTREVVSAFYERKQRQEALTRAHRFLETTQKAAQAGAVSAPEVEKAGSQIGEAELGVAQADAAIRYLLGVGSKLDPAQVRDPGQAEATPRAKLTRPTEVPAALVGPLETSVKVPTDANLADVLAQIGEQAGVPILIDAQNLGDPASHRIHLPIKAPLPLINVLQALADQYELCFLLRDYGILVTLEDRARAIRARSVPEHLPLDADAR
jgi:hypothetical protein